MMNEYKVTLIIPCYNINSIHLSKVNPFDLMIESIINQTFGIDHIEVLLVDDASTDSTKEILTNLNKKYPSFKPIFLEKNSGRPSIPRNVGIDNATTDYIMFLDQDDKMDIRCVEKLYNEIINHQVDMVKANYSIQMDEKILNYDTGKNERLVIKPKNSDLVYLVSHFIWSSIYDKNFLNKHNIRFPDTQAEDNLFLSKCYNLSNKDIIALNDYYGVIYTANNSNSLSHSFTLKQITDYENIFEETMDSYIMNNQSEEFILLNLERYIIILIGSLLRSKESFSIKKEMIKNIKKFLIRYNDYNINLPLQWKIYRLFILNNLNIFIYVSSLFINWVFENSLFKKIFRNKNYN